jgi:ketosteroid isomerase-like protein
MLRRWASIVRGLRKSVAATSFDVEPTVTVKDAFSGGDQIAVSWTFSGTFTDQAPFTPPYSAAGKSFSVPATSLLTVRHGRITSVDDYYNLAVICW